MSTNKSRRQLLTTLGAVTTVSFLPACSLLPVIPKRPSPKLEDAAGWIKHEKRVEPGLAPYTLYIPRTEMGQHVGTALAQIACDALGIEWSELTVKLPNTRDIPRAKATVGSDSIKDFAQPLRDACELLRSRIGKHQSTRRYVGQSQTDHALDAVISGGVLFASDVRLPGMLYGRVLRAPAAPELKSKARRMNLDAAKNVIGFVAVVRDELLTQAGSEGVGIVASNTWALGKMTEALAIEWQVEGAFEQKHIDAQIDVDRHLARGSLRHSLQSKSMDKASAWDVDLRFDIPMAAHAALEPRCAVADYQRHDNKPSLAMWVGTQDLFYQQDVLVKKLKLDPNQVKVQAMRVGGAFGGKTISTVELEAAVLSRSVQAPVHVQWTREQEMTFAFHRPASTHRVRARLKDGKLHDWWHAFVSSHILFTSAVVPSWLQGLTNFIGDDGVARGAQQPYSIPNQRIEFDLERTAIHTGPWRGLGAGPNAWVVESVIDECAAMLKVDPMVFRLQHLAEIKTPQSTRLLGVLSAVSNQVAAIAVPASDAEYLRGRGLACGIYKGMSYSATVADVSVSRTTGEVKVLAMWCAHDCGKVINPDGVRAQTQGNLVWCIGMALTEQLTTYQSQIAQTNFGASPVPRMADVPALHVHLVASSEPSTGAGETAIASGTAAITNAIRQATGKRVTRLPVQTGDLILDIVSGKNKAQKQNKVTIGA
jgi:isoquinoline 1-oxidoreductase subunit beta